LDKSSLGYQSEENPEAVVNQPVHPHRDQDHHQEQPQNHPCRLFSQGNHRQLDQGRHRERVQSRLCHHSNQDDQLPHYLISPAPSVAMSLLKISPLTDRKSLDLHRLLVVVLQRLTSDVEEAHWHHNLMMSLIWKEVNRR